MTATPEQIEKARQALRAVREFNDIETRSFWDWRGENKL